MNKKITIGLFCDSFFPMVDGVVMVVDNYARRLMKYANVVVFVPSVFGQSYDDSIFPYKVVRCNSIKVLFSDYSLAMPKTTLNLYKEIKKYKLDLVHIHSPFTMGMYGVKYSKKNKVPLIGSMHSQFEQDFKRIVHSKKLANKLTRKLINIYNKCDECWTVNKEMARIYHEEYGYKRVPKIIPNATEMTPVKDLWQSKRLINNSYGIKSYEKVFLYVGRINLLKNLLFIVDVLKILKENKIRFRMLFVGCGQHEYELKDAIKANNLEKEVILCGKITDRDLLASIYARSDFFLFPSLYDANSLVQIEAASQKTPTVFIEGSATSSLVTNNVNGFISKNDIYDYADTIIKAIKDKTLYKKVSENAFKDLYITWDEVVEQVYKNYLEFIERK